MLTNSVQLNTLNGPHSGIQEVICGGGGGDYNPVLLIRIINSARKSQPECDCTLLYLCQVGNVLNQLTSLLRQTLLLCATPSYL